MQCLERVLMCNRAGGLIFDIDLDDFVMSLPESCVSSNECPLSPDKESSHEFGMNVREDNRDTICLDPKQSECPNSSSWSAESDQTLGTRGLDQVIDAFDQAFIEFDNLEHDPSPETEYPTVKEGNPVRKASLNDQLALESLYHQSEQLLQWFSSERKRLEDKRGNEELDVEAWIRSEQLRVLEEEEKETEQRKCPPQPSDSSKLETYFYLPDPDLLGHINKINAEFCAVDDSYGIDQPRHPQNQKSSDPPLDDAHHAGRDASISSPLVAPQGLESSFRSWLEENDPEILGNYSGPVLWPLDPSLCAGSESVFPQQPKASPHQSQQCKPAWKAIERVSFLFRDHSRNQKVAQAALRRFPHKQKLTQLRLRSLDQSLEEGLKNTFRHKFIDQYLLLVDAARQHPYWLDTSLGQLRNHRAAWDSAISTMRRLSRLEAPLSLVDVLCFLCASRTVVESSGDDKVAHMISFAQDLETWSQMFPLTKQFAKTMWDITMGGISTLCPKGGASRHATVLRLRDLVAAMVAKAKLLLVDEVDEPVIEIGKLPVFPSSYENRWQLLIHLLNLGAQPPLEGTRNWPCDSQICPNITRLQSITSQTPSFDPTVVDIATGFIFAIMVYFMLGRSLQFQFW